MCDLYCSLSNHQQEKVGEFRNDGLPRILLPPPPFSVYLFGLVLLRYPVHSEGNAGSFSYVYSILTLSKSSYVEIFFVTLSLGLLVYVFTSQVVSIINDWNLDQLAMTLAAHSTRGSWREVAVSVDTEIRRMDKFRSVIGNTILYVTGEGLITTWHCKLRCILHTKCTVPKVSTRSVPLLPAILRCDDDIHGSSRILPHPFEKRNLSVPDALCPVKILHPHLNSPFNPSQRRG